MFGAFQALLFVVILIPFGVRVAAGLPGVIVIVISGALTALAIGGFTAAMALKTGSSEAVQGSFPLLFIALFFSSAFFPRETMSGYRVIAGLSPVVSRRGRARPASTASPRARRNGDAGI